VKKIIAVSTTFMAVGILIGGCGEPAPAAIQYQDTQADLPPTVESIADQDYSTWPYTPSLSVDIGTDYTALSAEAWALFTALGTYAQTGAVVRRTQSSTGPDYLDRPYTPPLSMDLGNGREESISQRSLLACGNGLSGTGRNFGDDWRNSTGGQLLERNRKGS
jgi:hypothetical protein